MSSLHLWVGILFSSTIAIAITDSGHSPAAKVLACLLGVCIAVVSCLGLVLTVKRLKPGTAIGIVILLVWFVGTIAATGYIARHLQ